MESSRYDLILKELISHGVKFIVVGGISAALQGAPINTMDIDIVHSRSQENVESLLRFLEALDAYYRIQPERRLRPAASHLASLGHQLLSTKYGRLDLLGHIGSGRTYENLLPHTVEIDLGEGIKARILDLATLIEVKEELGGEKDLAALPLLRRTLAELRRRQTQRGS